jgi:hypothetical protein
LAQRRSSSAPRVVVIRRRAPVALHTATGADPGSGVQVYADGQLIARIDAQPELVPAVAGLLRGPAWLFLVAARLPVEIVARLWVLIPVQPRGDGAPEAELRDEDEVYAYPIAELASPAGGPEDDLATEAGRLLDFATRAPAPRSVSVSGGVDTAPA